MNGFQKAKVYLAAIFLGAASAAAYHTYVTSSPQDPVDEDLNQVMALIQYAYINKDKVSSVPAMKGKAIAGMLNHLDPHSSYLDPEETREMLAAQQEFVGVGMEISKEEDAIRLYPSPGSPAERAGVMNGDTLTHIDDAAIAGMDLEAIVKRVRGEAGTKVLFRLQRKDSNPVDVSVTREKIVTPAITAKTIGKDIGYIRIDTFQESGMAQTLESHVFKIREALGTGLKGYVIDLRSNLGGNLREATEISDSFLEQGTIVTSKGRNIDDNINEAATPGDVTAGKPIVVLVNGFSASASEILAGALQDHGRATIMGTQTFGKGSVQTVYALGKLGGIKFTTALYYTPSGRSIQGKGITPDVEVKSPDIDAMQQALKKAGAPREATLEDTIANPDPEGAADTMRPQASCSPVSNGTASADDESLDRRGRRDEMLLCAIEELRGTQRMTVRTPAPPVAPSVS